MNVIKTFTLFYTLTISFTSGSLMADTTSTPDEQKIYYHLHQAYEWGELHYKNKCLLSKEAMDKHLGKLKYSQINLVKSKFYSEYKQLLKLSINLAKYHMTDVEMLRMKIQT